MASTADMKTTRCAALAGQGSVLAVTIKGTQHVTLACTPIVICSSQFDPGSCQFFLVRFYLSFMSEFWQDWGDSSVDSRGVRGGNDNVS